MGHSPRDRTSRSGRPWSGLEPGERARHAAPQLANAGGVVDRLALLAEHRVGGTLSRQPLAAGQVGRDVRVALARLGEQRARLGARTSTSKRGERPGVDEPGGVAIARVGRRTAPPARRRTRVPTASSPANSAAPGYRGGSAATAHADARPLPRGAPDATAPRRAPRRRACTAASRRSARTHQRPPTNTRHPTARSPAATPRSSSSRASSRLDAACASST